MLTARYRQNAEQHLRRVINLTEFLNDAEILTSVSLSDDASDLSGLTVDNVILLPDNKRFEFYIGDGYPGNIYDLNFITTTNQGQRRSDQVQVIIDGALGYGPRPRSPVVPKHKHTMEDLPEVAAFLAALAPEGIRPENYNYGSDGANVTAAFEKAITDGRSLILDGNYVLTSPLSFELEAESLSVDGHGKIRIAADFPTPGILISAPYPTARVITSIVQTTRIFPGGNAPTDATALTVPGHDFSIGDLVKPVADNAIVPSPEATRVGEFVYIADMAGDVIYVTGFLNNTYTTNRRIVRVRSESQLIWAGPRFEATPSQVGWDTIMLQVQGFAFPYIRTTCEHGYDIGLNLISCFMAEVDIAGRDLRNRVSSEGTSGYLLQDSASAFTQAKIRGVDARHAYTTDSPQPVVNGPAHFYGQTIGAVISGAGYASSAAAFDTHAEAVDVTFVDLTTGRTRLGEDASGAAVNLRGIRNRVIGLTDRGSNAAVSFYAPVVGGCVDCEVRNVNYVGPGDGFRVGNVGGSSVTRPKLKSGLIRTSKNRSGIFWACTGAELDDYTLTPTGNATHEGIVLAGNADVRIRRLTIDLADYTGTTFRGLSITAATPGNRLRVGTVEVVNGAGKFATYLHAHSAVAIVEIGGLKSDVEPSGGYFQGIENLTSFKWVGPPDSVIGSAAPTTGTWVRGDIVWDDTPSAGGTMGWVCTASGTPGTWKTFGSIGA
jgi:hypothetical protein